MVQVEEDAPGERDRTRDAVAKLLNERQQTLALFCRVAGLEPYTPDKPVWDLLQEFCQVLMDYTAFFHFELYAQLEDNLGESARFADVAKRAHPHIMAFTDMAVAFNDRYDLSQGRSELDDLPEDLSRLGEAMATRIEYEDQIVGELLKG